MSDLRDKLAVAISEYGVSARAGYGERLADRLLPIVEQALAEQSEAIEAAIRAHIPVGPVGHDGFRRGMEAAALLVRDVGKDGAT